MTRHIAYDILIVSLVISGLLIDGLQHSDFFFAIATVLWVFQNEIEKKL
tara:strand:- start:34804 stop:34950 length:147 start_codon:yes stop_codon:yes gene_type:complete